MSCKHGNHERACDLCDAEEAQYEAGRKAGLAEAAATPSPVPADTAELPPLPKRFDRIDVGTLNQKNEFDVFTADQMRDYARGAIASRPALVAVVPEGWKRLMSFYCADTVEGLVRSMELHIKSLQDYGTQMRAVLRDWEGWALSTELDNQNTDLISCIEKLKAVSAPSQPDQSAQEVKCERCEDEGVVRTDELDVAPCPACQDADESAPAAPSAAQAAGVEWFAPNERMPDANKDVTCLLRGVYGSIKEARLHHVIEDDCDWRTADDNSELSNAWEVIAWRDTTPSEGVAAPVLEADLLALREDVAKLYQSAMAITSQAAQEFAQRVVEHVRRTHGVAPAQPSADQVRDAALAECEAICNNVHDQYHAQRLIRELRASGEKGADRG